MPIPIETGRTRAVVASELNLDWWLLIKTMFEHDMDDLPLETYRTRIVKSEFMHDGGSFTVAYMPQNAIAGAMNKVVRRVGGPGWNTWRGNLMVVKVDGTGHVVDLAERDIGLAEHLVLS